jgi:hypothetical protein
MSGGRLRCAYCGWWPAVRRRPGEPPTCRLHQDLPRKGEPQLVVEQLELELERELGLHDRAGERGAYRRE